MDNNSEQNSSKSSTPQQQQQQQQQQLPIVSPILVQLTTASTSNNNNSHGDNRHQYHPYSLSINNNSNHKSSKLKQSQSKSASSTLKDCLCNNKPNIILPPFPEWTKRFLVDQQYSKLGHARKALKFSNEKFYPLSKMMMFLLRRNRREEQEQEPTPAPALAPPQQLQSVLETSKQTSESVDLPIRKDLPFGHGTITFVDDGRFHATHTTVIETPFPLPRNDDVKNKCSDNNIPVIHIDSDENINDEQQSGCNDLAESETTTSTTTTTTTTDQTIHITNNSEEKLTTTIARVDKDNNNDDDDDNGIIGNVINNVETEPNEIIQTIKASEEEISFTMDYNDTFSKPESQQPSQTISEQLSEIFQINNSLSTETSDSSSSLFESNNVINNDYNMATEQSGQQHYYQFDENFIDSHQSTAWPINFDENYQQQQQDYYYHNHQQYGMNTADFTAANTDFYYQNQQNYYSYNDNINSSNNYNLEHSNGNYSYKYQEYSHLFED